MIFMTNAKFVQAVEGLGFTLFSLRGTHICFQFTRFFKDCMLTFTALENFGEAAGGFERYQRD